MYARNTNELGYGAARAATDTFRALLHSKHVLDMPAEELKRLVDKLRSRQSPKVTGAMSESWTNLHQSTVSSLGGKNKNKSVEAVESREHNRTDKIK